MSTTLATFPRRQTLSQWEGNIFPTGEIRAGVYKVKPPFEEDMLECSGPTGRMSNHAAWRS